MISKPGFQPPPIKAKTVLADEIYATLRASILDHELEFGARLNIDEIARSMKVSTTPVRQALSLLESEGLATRQPNRGFEVVATPDSRAITELYEIRTLLEPSVAAKAAVAVIDADIEELIKLVIPAKSHTSGTTTQEHLRADRTFHDRLAELAGNYLLQQQLAQLASRSRVYQKFESANGALLYGAKGTVEASFQEHSEIISALRARDPEQAREKMFDHLVNAARRAQMALSIQHLGSSIVHDV